MKKQHYLVIIFCLIVILAVNSIAPLATSNLEAILGKKTTQAMLDEIKIRVNDYSAITDEMFYEIVYDVTRQYGLELNEDDFNEIVAHVLASTNTKISTKISLIDHLKIFLNDAIGFFEKTFPNIKEKEVTITIPKISQIDEWVNEGIHFFRRSILPLITE